MPTSVPQFTPGPGPGSNPKLGGPPRIYEGFLPGDAGPTAEYATTTQNRSVAFYRGSYSSVSNAGDQDTIFPYAICAQSRQQANYRSPASQALISADNPAIADTAALFAQNRQQANYRGSYSLSANAADQASVTPGWAPTYLTRPTLNYATARSQTISPPSFTAALDAWAQTTFGRSAPYYTGTRAATISVWDPAAGSFADWTPAALLSRAVKPYSPPTAPPRVAWGQSIITDQGALGASSRPVAYYRAPAALTVSVYDPATNTFADWVPGHAMGRLGRQVAFYAAPRSLVTSIYAQPAASSSTDFAASVLSRQQAAYRGSYSLAANAADQSQIGGLEWTSAFQSRPSAFYTGPRSGVIAAYDTLPIIFGTTYVASVISRQNAFYRGSYSLNASATDQAAAAFGSEWTAAFQSRAQAYYRAPRSWLTPVYVDLAGCTTLYPDTMLGPDTPLFPDLCLQVELGFVTQGRIAPFYHAPAAFLASVYDQPPIIFGTTYVATTQSRRSANYRGSYSLAANAADQAQSIFATTWTPGVIQNRRVRWLEQRSTLAVIWDGLSGIIPGAPGGGGFGAVMSRDFFERYEARYKPRYASRYKPTIRKQKG